MAGILSKSDGHNPISPTGAPYNVVSEISPLEPDQEKTVSLRLPYSIHNSILEAEADYKRMVQESNENNNIKILNN